MSCWAAAFHAFRPADIVDNVDNVQPGGCLQPHIVNNVNIVTPGVGNAGMSVPPFHLRPASPVQATAELADRATIEAEPLLYHPALAAEPLPDIVEALAQSMAANPAHRITDHNTAMQYFRAQARRRLSTTNDPVVRGLLLGSERHRQSTAGMHQPTATAPKGTTT